MKKINFTATEDSAHHFSIRVPMQCQVSDGPNAVLGIDHPRASLLLMASAAEPRIWVEVATHHYQREIAPADWLEDRLRIQGYDLLEIRRLPGAAGDEVDILARHSDADGKTHLSRFYATKDSWLSGGGRMVTAMARTEAGHYSSVAEDLLTTVTSLRLTNRSGFAYAERLTTYSRGLPGDFLIFFPASWTGIETRADDDASGLLIYDIYGEALGDQFGRITVLCSGQPMGVETMLGAYLESVRSWGFSPTVGSTIEAPEFASLDRSWACLGHATPSRGETPAPGSPPPFEIRISIGVRENTWYLIGSLGVTRSTSILLSGFNRRAFEIVHNLMKTEAVG